MNVRPVRVQDIASWTAETDVIVVGFGVAGACAALGARESGARALILERAGGPGGAAALSDGMVYLGAGTSTQAAAGVSDDADAMRDFLTAACGPEPETAKIEAYVAGSRDHHDWLQAHGVQFLGAVNPESAGPSAADGEGLMFTGGENAAPFAATIAPAQRAHITQGGRPGGAALMNALSDAALEAGAEVVYNVRVDRLILEGERVVGVQAQRFGETLSYRAHTGVVLAAGGFAFNPEMLAEHAPAALRTQLRLGTEGDDGRGIRMAQAVGAGTRRMDSLECALPFNTVRSHVGGILVNERGERFVNEDTYMGRVGQAALAQGSVHLVLDEAHYVPGALPGLTPIVAETTAEIEKEIGLPNGSLEATLTYYNTHAVQGRDPRWGKAAPHLAPLEAPLAVFDLGPDRFVWAAFTLGGLATLPDGEVLDVVGEPIPGLYAAGRTTSGVAARGYASGLSLGDGSFFGRRAGRSAATPPPLPVEEPRVS